MANYGAPPCSFDQQKKHQPLSSVSKITHGCPEIQLLIIMKLSIKLGVSVIFQQTEEDSGRHMHLRERVTQAKTTNVDKTIVNDSPNHHFYR